MGVFNIFKEDKAVEYLLGLYSIRAKNALVIVLVCIFTILLPVIHIHAVYVYVCFDYANIRFEFPLYKQ